MDQRNDTGLNAPGGTPAAGAANTPNLNPERERSAMPETERELERTRDMVAQAAAPVMAEKTQEAIEETGRRLAGDERIKNQIERTTDAIKHDAQRMVSDQVNRVTGRIEDRANELKDRAAGSLEDTAQRIDDLADRHLDGGQGVRAQAGNLAHSTADTFESAARYLRSNDMGALQSDLERQVRRHPMQTLLVAVAAGWVAGKILR
jgi:ElaB/YqjD/DUF883 family membrane-anchored ribosome-binding protein